MRVSLANNLNFKLSEGVAPCPDVTSNTLITFYSGKLIKQFDALLDGWMCREKVAQ